MLHVRPCLRFRLRIGPLVAQHHEHSRQFELLGCLQPQVPVDYVAIGPRQDRNLEVELPNAAGHAPNDIVILARIARVGHETAQRPFFDTGEFRLFLRYDAPASLILLILVDFFTFLAVMTKKHQNLRIFTQTVGTDQKVENVPDHQAHTQSSMLHASIRLPLAARKIFSAYFRAANRSGDPNISASSSTSSVVKRG